MYVIRLEGRGIGGSAGRSSLPGGVAKGGGYYQSPISLLSRRLHEMDADQSGTLTGRVQSRSEIYNIGSHTAT